MNLKELIAFYESKLENPDLTRGSRKVATLILMELRRTERLNELVRSGDKKVRHKWPDEKPDEGWCLVCTKDYVQVVAFYNCDKEWRVPFYSEPMTNVKYWWNLPEVGNE